MKTNFPKACRGLLQENQIRSAKKAVQIVSLVSGPNFLGGLKFWKFRALYLYKGKKWTDLAFHCFAVIFYIIIY